MVKISINQTRQFNASKRLICINYNYLIITMYNDIEQVINENLTLKKAYQLSKAHQDQTQK